MARATSTPGLPLALQALLAVAAGVAQAASLAWPWSGEPLWWLQIASMAVLAWLVATFWWLSIAMHPYGGPAAPLAEAAVVGLAAFLASCYAAMLGIFCR